MGKSSLPFRLNVAGVFRNSQGNVLVCERTDAKGAWQIPQGGMENNETPEQAIVREMREELGVSDVTIVKRAVGSVRYEFPEEVRGKIRMAQKYCGQEQVWFLLDLPRGVEVDLSKGDGEFCAHKWVSVKEAMAGCIDWKKDAYHWGFKGLGLVWEIGGQMT